MRLPREAMRQAQQIAARFCRWIEHPLPTMPEFEKEFCCLSRISHNKDDHLARALNRAPLHGIDRFFIYTLLARRSLFDGLRHRRRG